MMVDFKIKHEELVVESDSFGAGTFGVVHKAQWREKEVAVKYFNNRTISDDPSFKRETQILQSIKHKNIVQLFGMGEKGKQHFMVMELAPLSLEQIIHDSKSEYEYDYTHVLHWALQLAEALDYCHTREIIHRDIKPPNMLLFDKGMLLKVCDFGTARLLDSATSADTFIGTPFYLAPEILEGKHSYKCDMFSFAVSLWEMITRHKPTLDLNQRDKLHPYTVFNLIGREGRRPPKIVGIPKFIDELMQRCWAQRPADRPSARDVVEKLQKVLKKFPDCHPLRKKGEVEDVDTVQFSGATTAVMNKSIDEEPTVIGNVPSRAPQDSKYYMHGLPKEQQPFVPIPDSRESMELYEKYCSYMLQKIKAENEYRDLEVQLEQLNQQCEQERHKQVTVNKTIMRLQSLKDEKMVLERQLTELKTS